MSKVKGLIKNNYNIISDITTELSITGVDKPILVDTALVPELKKAVWYEAIHRKGGTPTKVIAATLKGEIKEKFKLRSGTVHLERFVGVLHFNDVESSYSHDLKFVDGKADYRGMTISRRGERSGTRDSKVTRRVMRTERSILAYNIREHRAFINMLNIKEKFKESADMRYFHAFLDNKYTTILRRNRWKLSANGIVYANDIDAGVITVLEAIVMAAIGSGKYIEIKNKFNAIPKIANTNTTTNSGKRFDFTAGNILIPVDKYKMQLLSDYLKEQPMKTRTVLELPKPITVVMDDEVLENTEPEMDKVQGTVEEKTYTVTTQEKQSATSFIYTTKEEVLEGAESETQIQILNALYEKLKEHEDQHKLLELTSNL